MVASTSPAGSVGTAGTGVAPRQRAMLRITTPGRAEGDRGRGDARRLGLHDACARGGDRRRRSMEHMKIPGTDLSPSRVGLGIWAMGGWMWGGTDEERSIRTICAALERGITLIDTAPAYGQGRSEEIVGKAVARWGRRDRVVLAT